MPPHVQIAPLFRQVAAENHTRIALSWGAAGHPCTWTYGQLQARADDLAAALASHGVGQGWIVGLPARRTPDAVAAMLALWQLNAAFVPCPPDDSAARRSRCLQIAGAHGVIAFDASADIRLDRLAAAEQAPPRGTARDAGEQLAYAMFTSGSSGNPKAVAVPHRAVIRLVTGQDYLPFGPDLTFLQAAPLSFDASVLELWGALLHGGCCALFDEATTPSGRTLGPFLRTHKVNTAWLTASLFNSIVDEDVNCLATLRHLVIGGEQLSPPHVHRALNALPDTRLVNGYGPTENTTFTTCYEIPRNLPSDAPRVPIGHALNGTQAFVVDEQLQRLEPGSKGELVTTGAGLALGYLGAPEETALRFVPLQTPDGSTTTAYRTGDRVLQRPDGAFEFLERLDEQVKIDGFRIEPGEIEVTISQTQAAQRCKVVARKDPAGRTRIIAYVVSAAASLRGLREHVADRLPHYMRPDHWVQLTELPLTRNGKVAADELPSPWDAPTTPAPAQQPDALSQVLACWQTVLGAAPQDPTTGLFDAGGRSVDAMRLLTELEQLTGRELEPTFVFEFISAEHQAAELGSRGVLGGPSGIQAQAGTNEAQ